MAVKVTSRIKEWGSGKERQFQVSLLELATTIHRDAGNLAPRKSGNLISSGRIDPISNGYAVRFGGNGVPYGRIQELGGTIRPKKAKMLIWKGDDGKTHAAHQVTIKGKHYLQKAGDKNSKNFSRYLRAK
jgi:hypothetical protein